jgi:catechol 2,3-dioxygenase-like lactoylglutathione lyase family enzyme
MAVLRPHLALTVSDIERSIPFYTALLGVGPAKVRSGYAKFEVTEPALNFTLNEGERGPSLGALNHVGIQVDSTDDVLAARERLIGAGLAAFDEMDTTCCYALQDKIWVHDPDGTPWEVFAVKADRDDAGVGGQGIGVGDREHGVPDGQTTPCGCVPGEQAGEDVEHGSSLAVACCGPAGST